jgi:hypothetical protein
MTPVAMGRPFGEELRVVDVSRILAQVFDGRVERRAVGGVQASDRCGLADGGHDVEGVTGEHVHQDVTDPSVGFLVYAAAEQEGDC